LIVPVPDKTFTVAGKRRVFYRVVTGDTVKAIAKALAVTPSDLTSWNALDPDGNLHAKMVLCAWVAPSFDPAKHAVNLLDDSQLLVVTRGSPEHMDLAEARTGRVRSEYTAEAKEKLADVAKKFGMGSHDLARINRISYDTVLSKGQTIIVYQVADPNRSKRADDQWKKTPRARRGKLAGTPAARTASANVPDDDTSDADLDDDSDSKSVPITRPRSETTRSTTPETSRAKDPDARTREPRSADKTKGDSAADAKAELKRSRPEPADSKAARTTDDDASPGGPVTKPAQVQ
jgi:membrane-bound lytic murein transglycosylase D